MSFKSPSPKPHFNRTGSVFALPTKVSSALKTQMPQDAKKRFGVYQKKSLFSREKRGKNIYTKVPSGAAFFSTGSEVRGPVPSERKDGAFQAKYCKIKHFVDFRV